MFESREEAIEASYVPCKVCQPANTITSTLIKNKDVIQNMTEKYYPPICESKEFHCPHCGVFAHQYWSSCFSDGHLVQHLRISACCHCGKIMLWYNEKPLYPSANSIEAPHNMMPDEVSKIYSEARDIASDSPRSAAALLRLALQLLLKEIGGKGENINDDIGTLLRNNIINPGVQKACDVLRVTGNNAVHPGIIDVDDDLELTISLFGLLNYIVKESIERPAELNALFEKLPDGAKKSIEMRDKQLTLKSLQTEA